MSKNELTQVNKVFHTVVVIVSAALAIGALIYNPFYLVTSAMVCIFGLNAEIANADDPDIDIWE
jgi:hypothetical protein